MGGFCIFGGMEIRDCYPNTGLSAIDLLISGSNVQYSEKERFEFYLSYSRQSDTKESNKLFRGLPAKKVALLDTMLTWSRRQGVTTPTPSSAHP